MREISGFKNRRNCQQIIHLGLGHQKLFMGGQWLGWYNFLRSDFAKNLAKFYLNISGFQITFKEAVFPLRSIPNNLGVGNILTSLELSLDCDNIV